MVSSNDQQPNKSLTNFSDKSMFWLCVQVSVVAASVMRHHASTVVPVLRAKQIHTFAFALLDLKAIIVKKVRGCWAAYISLFVLFSTQCVLHIVTSKEVLCYYTDRREYLLLHLFKIT